MNDQEPKKGGMALLMAMGKPQGGAPADDGPPSDEMPPDEPQGDGYSIAIPEGYQPPDGKEPGQSFDAVCKMHVSDDGKLCIESVDGVSTGAEGQEESQEPPEEEASETPGQEAQEGDEQAPPEQAAAPPMKSKRKPPFVKDASRAMDMALRKDAGR